MAAAHCGLPGVLVHGGFTSTCAAEAHVHPDAIDAADWQTARIAPFGSAQGTLLTRMRAIAGHPIAGPAIV